MNSRGLAKITEWAKQNPLIGGILFVIVGVLMSVSAVNKGKKYSAFIDGTPVTGTVLKIEDANDGGIPPDVQLEARWKTTDGKSHTGRMKIFKEELETLKEGEDVDLVVDKGDPSQAMKASIYANDKPVVLFGIAATPLVFAGANSRSKCNTASRNGGDLGH